MSLTQVLVIRNMMGSLDRGKEVLEQSVLSICMGLVPYLEEHQRLRARLMKHTIPRDLS